MAQLPPIDDLGLLEIPERIQGERVLCRDLAEYLGCGVRVVQGWAKERQVLHRARRCPGFQGRGAGYVTPFIAARIIVYVRAKQEADREARNKSAQARKARRAQ